MSCVGGFILVSDLEQFKISVIIEKEGKKCTF